MFTKTVFALSAAIVLAGSSAALAMTENSDHRTAARAAFAQSSQQVRQNGASSEGVFVEGKIIGRDPDANVRLQLQRDYPWGRGH